VDDEQSMKCRLAACAGSRSPTSKWAGQDENWSEIQRLRTVSIVTRAG
jgi:hypothetical protein